MKCGYATKQTYRHDVQVMKNSVQCCLRKTLKLNKNFTKEFVLRTIHSIIRFNVNFALDLCE
jgi:hypothetical protein